MDCFHSFRAENKLESQKEGCENKDFCGFELSTEEIKILEFNQLLKFDKMPYIIHEDIFLNHLLKE